MSGRWLRLYDELLNDPKVQRLEPSLFKALINLWCLASKHDGKLPEPADITFALRLSNEADATALTDELLGLGLLDLGEDGVLRPHNWESRQFKSDRDKSAERMRNKRIRDASRDAPVTPPEQSRADTEQKGAEAQAKRRTQLPEEWKAPHVEGFSSFEIQKEIPQFRDYHTAKGSVMKDWDAAFRTWMRNSRKFGGKAPVGNGSTGRLKDFEPEPVIVLSPEERAKREKKAAEVMSIISRNVKRA